MEKTNNKELVDRFGYPIEMEPLKTTPREVIAANISRQMLNGDDKDIFVNSAVQYLANEGALKIEDNKAQLSLADPEFQNFCILYGTQKVMDEALDENLLEAYKLLVEYTDDVKYKRTEVTSLGEKEIKELDTFYADTPELLLAKQVCDIQLDINQTLNGTSGKMLTSFQANRIQEKFEELTPYLNFEQCAAGYYNISIIHRALLGEKDYYDPAENNAEKECLKKVLEYTSDYKRIGYCANRLGTTEAIQGNIRAAYRRALTVATSDNDLYKINMALAQCYTNDYKPKSSYNTQEDSEMQKLFRAEMYYNDALEHARDTEKLNILKAIGRLQIKQNKIDAWTQTQTIMAMEHLTGEDRCHMLMEIANRNHKLKTAYLEQTIYEADKSKVISKPKKSIIIRHVASKLEQIYDKEGNREKLEQLARTKAKYAPAQQPASNPLLNYKRGRGRK